VLRGVGHLQKLVFRILSMIMWAAPVGAFGAMPPSSVWRRASDALKALGTIMLGFYITCALFVVLVLGTLMRLVAKVNPFQLAQVPRP